MTREFKIPPVPRAARALDLLAGIVLVALFIGASMSLRTMFNYGWALPIFAMPPAGAAWTLFRMGAFVERLANRAWRESLAVTPFETKAWLVPVMERRLASALAPVYLGGVAATAQISLYVLNIMSWELATVTTERFVLTFVLVALMCAIPMGVLFWFARWLAIAGSYDVLLRLCRARSAGGLPVGLPAAWTALISLICVGPALVGGAVSRLYQSTGFTVTLLGAPFLAIWSAMLAGRKCKEAIRAYDEVDLSALTPLRDLAEPRPSWDDLS